MSRILCLALGYLAGMNALGMSAWNSLDPREQVMVATFGSVGTLAILGDRYIVRPHAAGGSRE